MSFLSDRAPDAAAIIGELGVPVTFTPWDPVANAPGTPVTINASVLLKTSVLQAPKGGKREIRSGSIRVLPTDMPAGRPLPDARDLFQVDGVSYACTDVPIKAFLMAYVVESITEHRISGTPHRIQR